MTEICIQQLKQTEVEQAAASVGRSFCNNPLFVRIFGADNPKHRQAALARYYLKMLQIYMSRDHVYGAFNGDTLCGVGVLIFPGNCKPDSKEKLQILRSLIKGNSARMTIGALQWLRFWVRHDPPQAHWHIGPVAVEPGLQTLGIGSLLMTEICRVIDAEQGGTYIEADTPEAVRLYTRFGFQIADEEIVHGIPTWFLSRVL